ncbi:MAG TPA: MBOAT family protein [Polyangia bacterium]|jgi:alginate O-acetyltransferase complex protein AlgI|nr:MBOAT family protein [Polyangia bacterium]
MVFSSPLFLFLFLPLVLAVDAVAPQALRNAFLLLASLAFYAWGEHELVLLLVASILLNWGLGLAVARLERPGLRRLALTAAVLLNIGALVYFKYTSFLAANLDALLLRLHRPPLALAPVHLPIGISFVTFEALSYVIDVYRREVPAQRDPIRVGLYISVFPHLVAGPILRYGDLAAALAHRPRDGRRFASGVERFILGFAKKILIANTVGAVADRVFALPAGELGLGAAWLGAVTYALQIYFDFSGYSDMAIGLGRLVGFELVENFDYPYTATSIQDFWRRWHISLSRWFRDYLYIPLGGNRHGPLRTGLHLVLVFLLCGLWHGASWNFVLWGLYHGTFLVLERTGWGRLLERAPTGLRRLYALLVVMVGWVPFRAATLDTTLHFLKGLCGLGNPSGDVAHAASLIGTEERLALLLGLVGAAPVWRRLGRHLTETRASSSAAAVHVALFLLALSYMATSTYNPFIYFRF